MVPQSIRAFLESVFEIWGSYCAKLIGNTPNLHEKHIFSRKSAISDLHSPFFLFSFSWLFFLFFFGQFWPILANFGNFQTVVTWSTFEIWGPYYAQTKGNTADFHGKHIFRRKSAIFGLESQKWPKMTKNGQKWPIICFFSVPNGTMTVSERFWSQFFRYEVHIVINW